MSLKNSPSFLLNFSEREMNSEEPVFYQFKSFRLNVLERQLLNDNVPVALTPKAFDVLVVLVERNGHLVEKNELLHLVWSDSFVEEANVSRIVHTLRKVLGEDDNGNKFIETLPKKGYRFVAAVEKINGLPLPNFGEPILSEDKQQPEIPTETEKAVVAQIPVDNNKSDSKKWLRAGLLIGGTITFLAVVLLFVANQRNNTVKKVEITRTEQITAWSGLDFYPSISPDGNIIAYSSDRAGSFEIYIKQLVAGAKEVQITFDGTENFQPAFSPDGSLLAYFSNKRGGIWIVPVMGGAPRQLTEFGSHPAWSPDGKMIAFAPNNYITDPGGRNAGTPSTLWLVSTQGGEPRQITQPNNPAGGHSAPSWSPDGRRIVFDTNDPSYSEVWSISATGDDLKKLSGNLGLATDAVYAPDGKSVFFVTGAGSSLYQVNLSAAGDAVGDPVKVFDASNSRIRNLSVAAKANRIVYSAMTLSSNLWKMPISPNGDAVQENTVHLTQNINIRNTHPAFSPDGKRIAYAAYDSSTNRLQIWMMDADGKNQTQLTSSDEQNFSPSWFPDGKTIAYKSGVGDKVSVSSIAVEGAKIKRLFELDHSTNVVRLSPDGKQFAFSSTRSGGVSNLWLSSSDGSDSKQLTFDKNVAGFPAWSPDGKLIAFAKFDDGAEQIAVVSSAGGGGDPVQLTFGKGQSWSWGWSPDGNKILFAGERDGIWNIYWISRATKEQRQLTNFTKLNSYVRYPAWSPLGDRIIYEYAETTGNIWMLEIK